MKIGRTNMAIVSLYSIFGAGMTRKFEYMVGKISNLASLLLYSILESEEKNRIWRFYRQIRYLVLPKISNIAIKSMNYANKLLYSILRITLDIEYSDFLAIYGDIIAIFDIRCAIDVGRNIEYSNKIAINR